MAFDISLWLSKSKKYNSKLFSDVLKSDSNWLNTIRLMPQRVECLKITWVLVMDFASISANCSEEFNAIQGTNFVSLTSVVVPNNFLIKLIFFLLKTNSQHYHPFLTIL